MALPQDDFEPFELDEFGLDLTVPGIPGLLLNEVKPKVYPINIYNLDGRKESGLAGTLYPDGTFVPLHGRNLPRSGEHFDEQLKTKVPHSVEWDGNVVGCVAIPVDDDEGGEPLRRLCDGSILGPWPIHPPKPDRIVNPIRAREAALENEREMRDLRGGVL